MLVDLVGLWSTLEEGLCFCWRRGKVDLICAELAALAYGLAPAASCVDIAVAVPIVNLLLPARKRYTV
jgi:hypothetical protein